MDGLELNWTYFSTILKLNISVSCTSFCQLSHNSAKIKFSYDYFSIHHSYRSSVYELDHYILLLHIFLISSLLFLSLIFLIYLMIKLKHKIHNILGRNRFKNETNTMIILLSVYNNERKIVFSLFELIKYSEKMFFSIHLKNFSFFDLTLFITSKLSMQMNTKA